MSSSPLVLAGFALIATLVTELEQLLIPNLVFDFIPEQNIDSPPFTISATSNSSGTITYVLLSGPGTLVGQVVTITGTGSILLGANQAADGLFEAATTTTSVVVEIGGFGESFGFFGSGL